jgi:hypothetical protein
MAYSKEDILKELEDNSPYKFFLDLEHGYFYTAGSRITLLGDNERWAIVFEKTGFANRSGHAEIELNYYGNCLINLEIAGFEDQFICNAKYLILIDGNDLTNIESDFELISKEAKSIKVRGQDIVIEQDIEKYLERGIQIQDFDNPDNLIDFQSLIRYLDEENKEIFRANEQELRTCLPGDLPLLLQIDRWHHKPYSEYGGVKPREYETFQMIADILVTKDINKWKPTLKANNDWRNWPEAGGL